MLAIKVQVPMLSFQHQANDERRNLQIALQSHKSTAGLLPIQRVLSNSDIQAEKRCVI